MPDDLKKEVLELIENNPPNRSSSLLKSSTVSNHLSKPCSSKANKIASNKGVCVRQTKTAKKPCKQNTLLDVNNLLNNFLNVLNKFLKVLNLYSFTWIETD